MPYFAIDEEESSSKETENDSVVMENFSNVKAKKILLSNEKLKILHMIQVRDIFLIIIQLNLKLTLL